MFMKKQKYVWLQRIFLILLLTAMGISTYMEEGGGDQWEKTASIAAGAAEEWCDPPRIAITFDDGPHPKHTPQLLNGLQEREVKAAFFLIGENAEKYPELVRREYDEGHIVGNHTYHHVDLNKVTDEVAQKEIRMTNELLERITGEIPQFLRPPFGIRKKGLEQNVDAFPVLWTIDPLDWQTDNIDEIVNKVVTQAKDGDIILLHDCYDSSVQAAFRMIDLLKEQGFEFVRVDELIVD